MNKTKKIILWSLLICLLLGAAGFGGWYWYDNNVDRSGWREKDGITMYADFHGKPVSGWQEIDGERYYFSEDYALQTGWLELSEGTYYLDNRGRMQTGWLDTAQGRFWLGQEGTVKYDWQEIDGSCYYFHADGTMATHWLELEDSRHYLNEEGILQTGWTDIEDHCYYLDEQGSPTVGWADLEDHRYYFDQSGAMFTGREVIDDRTYFFGETGAMHTGWLEDEAGRSYYAEDGAQCFGWTEIEEKRYYFSEEGYLHTGWLQLGEYRYYFHDDGTTAAGPVEIDGELHYFSPKGILVLLVNPWHPLSSDYEIDLVEIEDGWMVDRQALEPLKAMFAAMREEGLLPYFSSTYRNHADQQAIWKQYVDRYKAQGYDEATANAMTASYVAVPGTSEHHTGLAVDIVGHDYKHSGHPGSTMAVQAWLAEHCWEYGFILRYTAEKQSLTGFAPETWHFRYVGTEVSMDMKDSGLCLEEYLQATRDK